MNKKQANCCRLTWKELLFILAVLLTEIGSNISFDTPGAMQNAIVKNYHLTSYQFAMFYSLYFIPSIILNPFSGFLIDRVLGIRLSSLAYYLIGVAGVTLFAVGGASKTFGLMLLGRLIFGMGDKVLTGVCINYCIYFWYKNSIMNLVLSLSADGNVLGSLIVYQMGPAIQNYFSKTYSEKESLDMVIVITSSIYVITGCMAYLMTFLKPNDDGGRSISDSITKDSASVTMTDIVHFPPVFWLLCLLRFLIKTLNTFNSFCQGLLTSELFNLTVVEARNAYCAMGVVNIVFSIPMGICVDMMGRNTSYVLLGTLLGTLSFLLLAFKANPYACMIILALSNSAYNAAIKSMPAYTLDKKYTGYCYGIVSTAGCLSLASSPLIVGYLIDTYGYSAAVYFFMVCSTSCFVCIIVIWILDSRCIGILNMTPSERIEYENMLEKSKMASKNEMDNDFTYRQSKSDSNSSRSSSISSNCSGSFLIP